MSKPADKTLIGVFVLGAIVLLVIAVVVLGSGKFFRKTIKAVCFFEGSVAGLNAGAPVVFNGVRIGSVTDLVLRYDPNDLKTTIAVYIEIVPQQVETVGPSAGSFAEDLRVLIDHGLKARLELQSIITGTLQVALGSYPDRPSKPVGADKAYPEIPTIPTPFQEITKKIEQLPLEEFIKNIASAVDGISRVLNSREITKTIQSVSRAAEEAEGLIRNLNSRVQPVSSDARQALQEARKLLQEIDTKTSTLTSSIDGTVKDVQKLARKLDGQIALLGPSMRRTLSSIEKTSDEAEITLRKAQHVLLVLEGDIGEDSELIYELKNTVREAGTAAKAVRSLAKALEQQPESLLFGTRKSTGR
ncbi:MAG: MCE family protein [Deltaproteobacteria bacterium]|nr:MCE family protein [Deltaproteobacteria bacterium]